MIDYELNQNLTNPLNPTTKTYFVLPEAGTLNLFFTASSAEVGKHSPTVSLAREDIQ